MHFVEFNGRHKINEFTMLHLSYVIKIYTIHFDEILSFIGGEMVKCESSHAYLVGVLNYYKKQFNLQFDMNNFIFTRLIGRAHRQF